MTTKPTGLRAGGKALWDGITSSHDLNDAQLVQLTEACRAKDRLDRLDVLLRVEIENATLMQANATANLLKQLLAAMRLPDDVTGKRPQVRSARGGYAPSGAKVSSIRQRLSS